MCGAGAGLPGPGGSEGIWRGGTGGGGPLLLVSFRGEPRQNLNLHLYAFVSGAALRCPGPDVWYCGGVQALMVGLLRLHTSLAGLQWPCTPLWRATMLIACGAMLDRGAAEGHKGVLQVQSALQWGTCGFDASPCRGQSSVPVSHPSATVSA